jgi:hypothetical protein
MQQLAGNDLKKMIAMGAHLLGKNKEIINILNTFPVPDGDTGTNMDLTLRSALNELKKVSENSVSSVAGALAMGTLLGARGNSGVILSQLFRGFAKGVEGKEQILPQDFADALQVGVTTAYKAVMKPVEGTMLTIARESAKMAKTSAKRGADFTAMMQDLVEHAQVILEKTPDMLPVLKEAGVVDAGGKGLLHIYEGFMLYLLGEDVPVDGEVIVAEPPLDMIRPQEYFRPEDITFTYCTEFMLRGEHLDPDRIRDMISGQGDSVLSVGDEKIVRIHIHTNNPGQILEQCVQFGSLHKIKIDNMREQHAAILFQEEEAKMTPEVGGFATIAVSAGTGMAEILQSIGVTKIIPGGQTMNPSTEDFLQAVKEVPQKEIIILPNNKNIILAAEQVREFCDKDIRVIKSRSVPQGIAAMLAFNTEETLDENEKNMADALKKIKSGQITFAVHDSRFNGLEIHENDIIGIFEDEIVAVGSNVDQVARELLFKMVSETDEIITLYYGEPVTADEASAMQQDLSTLFAGRDVELYEGSQPFYYYLVSVE